MRLINSNQELVSQIEQERRDFANSNQNLVTEIQQEHSDIIGRIDRLIAAFEDQNISSNVTSPNEVTP